MLYKVPKCATIYGILLKASLKKGVKFDGIEVIKSKIIFLK